jgi:hypothetical protein
LNSSVPRRSKLISRLRVYDQVINEDGLPIFDIREDLPQELEPTPVNSSSSKAPEPAPKKPMRYLVKKGGKQIVRKWQSASALSH